MCGVASLVGHRCGQQVRRMRRIEALITPVDGPSIFDWPAPHEIARLAHGEYRGRVFDLKNLFFFCVGEPGLKPADFARKVWRESAPDE